MSTKAGRDRFWLVVFLIFVRRSGNCLSLRDDLGDGLLVLKPKSGQKCARDGEQDATND